MCDIPEKAKIKRPLREEWFSRLQEKEERIYRQSIGDCESSETMLCDTAMVDKWHAFVSINWTMKGPEWALI